MQRKILILAEGRFSPLKSKTANGAISYLPQDIAAVIDSTKAGMTAQQVLGYGGDIPVVRNLEEGLRFNPTHLLIGIAPTGGRLPDEWREILLNAINSKLHILNGLHTILTNEIEFQNAAAQNNVTITDYRKIQSESEVVAQGSYRERKAKVILTVGTDCNIGKMTTLLEMKEEFDKRNLKCDFIATGQTGILLRGRGIAVDSMVGDYIAGSVEKEIDQSVQEGYDFILVEGQGSLTHMGYSGVTLGLLHGSMPDAMILCHQPTRLTDNYGLPLPDLSQCIAVHEDLMSFFKPSKVVGIGLNSVGLTERESQEVAEELEKKLCLPTVDAFRFGAAKLVDAVLNYLQEQK
jgi:uncharacterized NAD-dependent epimerase/dehydratase family protein